MEFVTNCVFCAPAESPLFETASLYALPDRYPLLPGHVLLIPHAHLRCHAELPETLEAEREEAAARLERFLRDVYGMGVLTWENGVFGQTVFHAHLHLVPVPAERFPRELDEHPDVVPVTGWDGPRAEFTRRGGYRLMRLGGEERLILGHSPALGLVREWLAATAGLRYDRSGWLRATTPADVEDLRRRWEAWRERVEGDM